MFPEIAGIVAPFVGFVLFSTRLAITLGGARGLPRWALGLFGFSTAEEAEARSSPPSKTVAVVGLATLVVATQLLALYLGSEGGRLSGWVVLELAAAAAWTTYLIRRMRRVR